MPAQQTIITPFHIFFSHTYLSAISSRLLGPRPHRRKHYSSIACLASLSETSDTEQGPFSSVLLWEKVRERGTAANASQVGAQLHMILSPPNLLICSGQQPHLFSQFHPQNDDIKGPEEERV